MKKETRAILIFILLTIGSITYVIYNARMPIDPNRIQLNENGEEIIVLNEMEKKQVGKWYISYEGETPINMVRKPWIFNQFWDFKDNGVATNNRADGRKISFNWQISETDSIFRLIPGYSRTPDTIRYKIYFRGENGFSAYKFPRQAHEKKGYFEGWSKHDRKQD